MSGIFSDPDAFVKWTETLWSQVTKMMSHAKDLLEHASITNRNSIESQINNEALFKMMNVIASHLKAEGHEIDFSEIMAEREDRLKILNDSGHEEVAD